MMETDLVKQPIPCTLTPWIWKGDISHQNA